MDSAAAMTILSAFAGERVWVEEQDHTYYILHMDHEAQEDGDPEGWKWIVVSSESPLFGPLRECHHHDRKWWRLILRLVPLFSRRGKTQ